MQLQEVEQPIDYEEVLTKIIEDCKGDEIIPFVRCLKFPFKFCEKLLNKKGVSWRTKVEIAKRVDCPESVVVKLCKRNGERFLRNFLYNFEQNDLLDSSPVRKQISNKVADAILIKPCGLEMLCLHSVQLPEKAQEKIVEKCFEREMCEKGHLFSHRLLNFIRNQDIIPQHCIAKIDEALQKEKELQVFDEYEENRFQRHRTMLNCMRTPVDEKLCIDVIENYEKNYDKSCLHKVACNPSISKYVEMMLSMKFANDEIITLCMKRSEETRNAWRKADG